MWLETVDVPAVNISYLNALNQEQVSPAWPNNSHIERAKVRRLTREVKEVTTLYNIGVAVGSSLSLEEVIWTLYKESGRLMDTSNFAIALYDDHTDTLNFTLVFDRGERIKPFSVKRSNAQGLTGHILTSQAPLLVGDMLENNPIETGSFRSKEQIHRVARPVRSWLGVPILNPVLTNENAPGVIVTWSYEPNAFTDHDLWLLSAIGTQAAMAIRNAHLFEACQRRAMEVAAINEVARTLSSTLHLDQVLSRIMKQVEALLEVEAGSLFLTDPPTGDLVFQIALDNKTGQARPFRLPKGQGLAGEVALTGRPLMATNVDRHTRNVLGVPLVLHDQIIGVLEVMNKKEGPFTRNDLELLTSIASFATIAIENARLHESVLAERDRVIEAEEQVRRKLARDLHDGPTQLVSGMMMHLEFCQKALETDPSLLAEELPRMKDLAAQAVHQMRTTLFELRPLVLETQGLAPALQAFLERRQKEVQTTKLTLNLKSSQPDGQISRQEAEVEAAIFAIVQEAVNNALKHTRANNIMVHLKETPTAIYAIVIDDGQGFDLDQVMHRYQQRGSLGLVNIRERTELIGGELTLKSGPGRGTHIAIYVPKTKAERTKKRQTTGRLSGPWPSSA